MQFGAAGLVAVAVAVADVAMFVGVGERALAARASRRSGLFYSGRNRLRHSLLERAYNVAAR